MSMRNIFLLPTTPNDETAGGIWIPKTRDWCNIYIASSDEEIKEGEYGISLSLLKQGFKAEQSVFEMDEEQRQAIEWLGGQKKAEVFKIILTTDPKLIADGVQKIDDEFLEWFVKNPSCDEVDVIDFRDGFYINNEPLSFPFYKIIIPSEEPKTRVFGTKDDKQFWSNKPIQKGHPDYKETLEPKQETLEEAYWELVDKKAELNNTIDLNAYANGVVDGVKWQAERMYSEEEVLMLLNKRENYINSVDDFFEYQSNEEWFEKNKKKV